MNKPWIHHRSRLLTAALLVALAATLSACERNISPNVTPEKSSGMIEQPKDGAANIAMAGDSASDSINAGNTNSDAVLAARVKSALIDDPALKPFNFDVLISNGVASLFGTVDSPDKRTKASDLALNVPGVQSVRNNIQLTRGS